MFTIEPTEPKRLLAAEIAAHAKAAGKLIELESIQAQAATALADGAESDFGDAAQTLLTRKTEADLIQRAIAGIRTRREASIRSHYETSARKARELAAEKRAEAGRILAACMKHLEKLSEIQDVHYSACILHAQRTPGWLPDVRFAAGDDMEHRSPFEATPDINARYVAPKSRRLLDEAAALEQDANNLEATPICRRGQVDAEDAEGLRAAVTMDALVMQPRLSEIDDWISRVDARLNEKFPNLADERRRYRLEWDDAQIDSPRSYLGIGTVRIEAVDPAVNPGTGMRSLLGAL